MIIMPRLHIQILLTINLLIKQAQAEQYEDNTIKIEWIVNDQSTTNFTMSSSSMSSGNYFSFGLSKDQKMVTLKNIKNK